MSSWAYSNFFTSLSGRAADSSAAVVWRSAAEVRGDGETAMGKNFGGAGGGGRQGDEEQVELPEQGDEQLV